MGKEVRQRGSRFGCIACVVALALACGGVGCAAKQPKADDVQDQATDAQRKEETPNKVEAGSGKLPETTNPKLADKWTEDITRLADASGVQTCVSAIDLSSGTTVAYHDDEKMLSASMIKLIIAETFLHQVDEGKHALDETYVLKPGDIVGGTGSLGGRGAGAKVSCRELVQLMIAESDNVATNALIDLCGMDAVNKEAKRLKLKRTELGRHMMDTAAAEQGHDNYTCADDLATLLKMVYDQTFVSPKLSTFMLECLEAQTDNDAISRGLPTGTLFAHKTGTLANARHDGGIVEGKKPYVLVVLCGGRGFSEDQANQLMADIGKATYDDINAV